MARDENREAASQHLEEKPTEETNEMLDKTNEVRRGLLDDIVGVNKFFNVAIFVGLAFTGEPSLARKKQCQPDHTLAEKLLVYEVLSFTLFLYSTLLAKALKAQINIKFHREEKISEYNRMGLMLFAQEALLMLSMLGTFVGCVLLMLSMALTVEIRIGKLSCGSKHVIWSLTPLFVFVSFALAIYFISLVGASTLLAGSYISYFSKHKDHS